MWRFFWVLVILFFSIWLGLKIAEDPGYLFLTYQHWSVEMPLWFAVLAFLLIIFLFYIILRFLDTIDFSIYRLKNWVRYRRKYRSYSKTNRGLIELIEGQWRMAEHDVLAGVQQSDVPLINYLAAAKAAQEQGADDRRDTFLLKAHQIAPHAEVAIGLTQAKLQFDQGQLEQALATLDRLKSIAPKHARVLTLLEKVYVRLSDWEGLLTLLPALRKAKVITNAQHLIFEKNIYQELLRQASHKQDKLTEIDKTWKAIPKKLKRDPDLVKCYVTLLFTHPEKTDECEILIEQVLKKTWQKELVRLYGLLKTADPKKALNQAENWQKHYANQAILLLTLGRLSVRCQLWGKAKTYFENSLKQEAHPETYAEYGKLLERLGEPQAALKNYREGLLQSQ